MSQTIKNPHLRACELIVIYMSILVSIQAPANHSQLKLSKPYHFIADARPILPAHVKRILITKIISRKIKRGNYPARAYHITLI